MSDKIAPSETAALVVRPGDSVTLPAIAPGLPGVELSYELVSRAYCRALASVLAGQLRARLRER